MPGTDTRPGMREALKAQWPAWALFLIFLWPQLAVRDAFVLYDFALQHLPWASELARSLGAGRFPWWTSTMGNGFPLVAEGQVGAFYPPHLVAYKLLPFWPAYAWMAPTHFGIAILLMYGYVRRLGLRRSSAGLAATVYAFGAGYAGCFLNVAALKVLCWTPVVLHLSDVLQDRKSSGSVQGLAAAGIALAVALQWTAGAAQMAAYACGYYVVHAAVSAAVESRAIRSPGALIRVVLCVLLGTLMAAMQIGPSLELIGSSARGGQGAAFALWGSVLPVAPLTLLFPEWGNTLRYSFYIGIVPLIFALSAITLKNRRIAAQTILVLLFLFLALGKYNPAYRWIIEETGWTFFRGPFKLLYFAMLHLAVLAGYGWDRYMSDKAGGPQRLKTLRIAVCVLVVAACLPAAAQLARVLSEAIVPDLRAHLAARIVAEKGDLAKPLSYYHGVLDEYFDFFGRLFSYGNPLNVHQIMLAAGALLALCGSARCSKGRWTVVLLLLLVWDLGVFGYKQGTGFLGNTGHIRDAVRSGIPESARPPEGGSYAERMGGQSREHLPANAGMTYGVAQAGAYSPLLLQSYHELVYPLSLTDSSLGRAPEDVNLWRDSKGLIDLLGIAVLREPASSPDRQGWSVAARDEDSVYRANPGYLPELVLYKDWLIEPDKERRLRYLRSGQFDAWATVVVGADADVEGATARRGAKAVPIERLSAGVSGRTYQLRNSDGGGIALFRQCAYTGWSLRVDGRPRSWFVADHAFIGFRVDPGDRMIELRYRPASAALWGGCAMVGWSIWAVVSFLALRARRRSHFLSHLPDRRI